MAENEGNANNRENNSLELANRIVRLIEGEDHDEACSALSLARTLHNTKVKGVRFSY